MIERNLRVEAKLPPANIQKFFHKFVLELYSKNIKSIKLKKNV